MSHPLENLVFDCLARERNSLLAFWEELVNMESGSRDKENVDKAAERVEKELRNIGAETEILRFEKAGNSVAAVLGKDRRGAPVALMGHYDTVFPSGTVAKRPFRIEDGKAFGPGVLDMKGGVALLIYAAKALEEAGYRERPIRFIIAGDEETAHCNSDMAGKNLRERSKGPYCRLQLRNCDPPPTKLSGRKGVIQCEMAEGICCPRAGSEPQKGRSAIPELPHKIVDIQSHRLQPGLTFIGIR